MISKIKKFAGLPVEEKWWFVEAWFVLGLMRATILVVPFRKLTRSLQKVDVEYDLPALAEGVQETAARVGKSIATAANHTPWRSACLVQSLTARKMLGRRGIPGIIVLGVAKEDDSIEKMKAHAWTRCGELIITGRSGHEGFTAVGTFLWGADK